MLSNRTCTLKESVACVLGELPESELSDSEFSETSWRLLSLAPYKIKWISEVFGKDCSCGQNFLMISNRTRTLKESVLGEFSESSLACRITLKYAVNFGGRFLLFLTRSKSNSKSLQKGNLARLIELFDSGPGLHPVPKLRNKVLYCCSKRVHCQLFYFEIEFSLDKVLRTYFKEKLLLVE